VIQHVSLECRPADAETELRFWSLLGFEQVTPPGELGRRSAWTERAGTQIHLLYADDPVVAPEGHVAVVAADYDATLRRLREAGFPPEPHAEHWGAPRSFVRSPVGHRVEVMAAPPAMRSA
jgi:catechol 2,3-dioxygenase-like lactoylglutathione lyase family enzyme